MVERTNAWRIPTPGASTTALLFALACGDSDSDEASGSGTSSGGGSSESATTTDSQSSTTGSTSSATTDTTGGSTGPTGETGTGADVSTTGADSSSGGAVGCNSGRDACMICLGELCCMEFEACAADPACLCPAECMGAGGTAEDCLDQCGGDATQEFDDLVQCALAQCPDADECPDVPN